MQPSIQKQAKISELLSVCVQLAFESSKIIQNIHLKDEKNVQMKGVDDPMTIADIKAQTLIIKGLRQFWPDIKIVGEEDVEYEGDLGFDTKNLNINMINSQTFMEGQNGINLNNEFDVEKAVVWVDPLDGTLSYVNNELDCVTTLIGVSYDQKPLMGIIGQPFKQEKDNSFQFDPTVYFGHAQNGKIFSMNLKKHQLEQSYQVSINPEEYQRIEREMVEDGSRKKIIASTSKNHMSPEKLELVKSLNIDEVLRYGGAGKKCIDIIKGITDLTIYIGQGTKKWDSCAGDALIRCLGGTLTGTDGAEYDYDPNPQNHKNKKGLIACVDGDLHQKIISQTQNFEN